MNREELAWAAGFWDGEGSTHVAYARKNKTTRYLYVQSSLMQCGSEAAVLLAKFQQAVGGLGKIYGPYSPGKNQRLCRMMLEINGFEKVQALMAMLWVWLGPVKRKQFIEMLRKHGRQNCPI